jgi:Ca2+-binding EF-hand superfamily protein
MNRPLIIASILSAFAALPANAHDGYSRTDHNRMLSRMMTMMDMNSDGAISTTEHEAGAREMFINADNDANGYLNREEMRQYGIEMRKEAGVKRPYNATMDSNPHPHKDR